MVLHAEHVLYGTLLAVMPYCSQRFAFLQVRGREHINLKPDKYSGIPQNPVHCSLFGSGINSFTS
jgi:hypothetical protein